MQFIKTVLNEALGDPSLEGLQPKVTSYEELHAEVQGILVPTGIPSGIQVNVVQPLNSNFAVSHRMFLASEKKDANPFAAMFGGGKPKSDSLTRLYGLGGILSSRFANGGRLRLFTQLDTSNIAKSSLLYDPWGTGRLTLLGQLVSTRTAKGSEVDFGVTARLSGPDYTAVVRAANGPEFGLSYLQRLTAGSPITLGGEVFFSSPAFSAIKRDPAATFPAPLEWALGAAYDARSSKSGIHLANTSGSWPLVNAQHLYRLSERSSLCAKLIFDLGFNRSMAAVGYRLKFKHTRSTVSSAADTYGGVCVSLDRELFANARMSLFLHYNYWQKGAGRGGASDANGFGIKVTLGQQPRIDVPMSPCTMNRIIFKMQ